jgi:hypothetical protein
MEILLSFFGIWQDWDLQNYALKIFISNFKYFQVLANFRDFHFQEFWFGKCDLSKFYKINQKYCIKISLIRGFLKD